MKRLILLAMSISAVLTTAGAEQTPQSQRETPTIEALLAYVLTTFAPFFEPSPLKRERPNELVVSVVLSDGCSISQAEAVRAAKSILVRSKIEPLDEFTSLTDHFFLSVAVNCLEASTAYAIDVDFADVIAGVPVRFGTGYGSFGTYGDDKHYLVTAIEANVKNAISDYLKANVSRDTRTNVAGTTKYSLAADLH